MSHPWIHGLALTVVAFTRAADGIAIDKDGDAALAVATAISTTNAAARAAIGRVNIVKSGGRGRERGRGRGLAWLGKCKGKTEVDGGRGIRDTYVVLI